MVIPVDELLLGEKKWRDSPDQSRKIKVRNDQ